MVRNPTHFCVGSQNDPTVPLLICIDMYEMDETFIKYTYIIFKVETDSIL